MRFQRASVSSTIHRACRSIPHSQEKVRASVRVRVYHPQGLQKHGTRHAQAHNETQAMMAFREGSERGRERPVRASDEQCSAVHLEKGESEGGRDQSGRRMSSAVQCSAGQEGSIADRVEG